MEASRREASAAAWRRRGGSTASWPGPPENLGLLEREVRRSKVRRGEAHGPAAGHRRQPPTTNQTRWPRHEVTGPVATMGPVEARQDREPPRANLAPPAPSTAQGCRCWAAPRAPPRALALWGSHPAWP